MRIVSVILALLLLSGLAGAFTVSPASKDYIMPATDSYELTVSNDGSEAIDVRVRVDREARPFVRVEASEWRIAPQSSVRIPVEVAEYEQVLPGTYEGGIIIEQLPAQGTPSNTVQAIPAVKHRVRVTAPGQGTFLRASLLTSQPSEDEPVIATVVVENIGTEAIRDVQARIEIRSPANEPIETLTSRSKSLEVGQTRDFTFRWKPEHSGIYTLTAVITYDGRTTSVSETIEVGILNLALGELALGDFRLGQIARVDLPVTSEWNARLRNVYADYRVLDEEGTQIDAFTGLSEDIPARGQATLTGFWNTAGLSPGIYTLEARVHYADKTAETSREFSVGLDEAVATQETGSGALIAVLFMAGAVLVVLWYVWSRRREREEST